MKSCRKCSESNKFCQLKFKKSWYIPVWKREITLKAEFERYKQNELNTLQSFTQEEKKKIAKEKKALSARTKSLSEKKSEKEEIELLKRRIETAEQELKQERDKNKATVERLKSRIQVFTARNEELEKQVRVLEQSKISEWRFD